MADPNLNAKANPRSFQRALRGAMNDIKANAYADQSATGASDITPDLGDMVAGRFIAAASDTTEPTDETFSGVFMAANGEEFNGVPYNIGGVSDGVLQFGLRNSDGGAVFLGGAMGIDGAGINGTLSGAVITQRALDPDQLRERQGQLGMFTLPGEDVPSFGMQYARPVAGTELITDPDFPNLTNWTATAQWTAVSGRASYREVGSVISGTRYIEQNVTGIIAGERYQVSAAAALFTTGTLPASFTAADIFAGQITLCWYDVSSVLIRCDYLATSVTKTLLDYLASVVAPTGATNATLRFEITLDVNTSPDPITYGALLSAPSLQLADIANSLLFHPDGGDLVTNTELGDMGRVGVAKARQIDPTAAPTLATLAGGSLAASTTYYYKYTWLDRFGESLGSPAASIATTSTNKKIRVTKPTIRPPFIDDIAVYRSTDDVTYEYIGTTSGAVAAIAYDSSGTYSSAGAGTSLSGFTHTATGADIGIAILFRFVAAVTNFTATYGGVAMTMTNIGGTGLRWIATLAGAATGAQTIAGSWTTSTNVFALVHSYTGVGSIAAPTNTANSSNVTTRTLTSTTAVDDMVVDFVTSSDTDVTITWAADGGQTERNSVRRSTLYIEGADEVATSTSTVTSWTATTTADEAQEIHVVMTPIAGGSVYDDDGTVTPGVALAMFNTTGSRPPAPTRWTGWADEYSTSVTVAKTLIATTSHPYGYYVGPTAANANDGDEYTLSAFLAAGSYTFYTLGATLATSGKVDYYLDATAVKTGQDWYSGSTVYNVTQQFDFTVSETGYYKIKMKLNGKNASSSDYTFYPTKFWIKPTYD